MIPEWIPVNDDEEAAGQRSGSVKLRECEGVNKYLYIQGQEAKIQGQEAKQGQMQDKQVKTC